MHRWHVNWAKGLDVEGWEERDLSEVETMQTDMEKRRSSLSLVNISIWFICGHS